MSKSEMAGKIDRILKNAELSTPGKIEQLTELYIDARALERAANEGGMHGDAGVSGENVRAVELALRELGVNAAEIDDQAAATL